MTDKERLQRLLRAAHPCVSIVTPDEAHARSLVLDAVLELDLPLYAWSVTEGLRRGLFSKREIVAKTEHPAAALYHVAAQTPDERAVHLLFDLGPHLEDHRTRRCFREALASVAEHHGTIILIDETDVYPPAVRDVATPFDIALPDATELRKITRDVLARAKRLFNFEVNLSKKEVEVIISNLRGLTRAQAETVVMDAVADDLKLDISDLNTIIASKRRHLQGSGVLEFIETPVDLSEIGGLKKLKGWLDDRKDALSEEAAAYGLTPPRGVLMLGVQGAGKSLCAKAIATAWKRPLLRLDPGRLYDRYVGESEKRLRDVLHQAEMMAPIVMWIDEIEKGFASAASTSNDGGLSRRMFGTLLTWMQDHTAPVFLVATANDIEALPPELLRKGRFDEIFFVDLPTQTVRRKIFEIHLKKRERDPKEFDLAAVAEASEGFSGAEIEQAVVASMHRAFGEQREPTTEDLIESLQISPPLSVTMAEKVAYLRRWASERCTPAD